MSGNASILQMEFEAHLIRQRKAFSQTQKAGIKKSPLARVYHALPMKLRNLGAISRMKERYVKQAYADAPDFTRLCMMSFVNYLLNSEEGAVERHAKLLCDDESRAVMHDALGHYVRCSFGGVPGAADLYGQELYSKIRKVGDNFEFMGATMPQNTFSPEAFLNHHGLVFLPGSVTGRLQGKDVIDLGAHIGGLRARAVQVQWPGREDFFL